MAGQPKIPRALFIIDEANRAEYSFIEESDRCYYAWERMSQLWRSGERPDFSLYPVNRLISNFQIEMSLKRDHPRRFYWKGQAIRYAARALSELIPDEWRECGTFVPVPPSKRKNDPDYDSRLLDTLRGVSPPLNDVRELILLNDQTFESKQKGLHPSDRAKNYSIDEDLADPAPDVIIIFDDVLTTGCHFKAAEVVLKRRFPDSIILGLFLARTVRPAEEYDDLSSWLL